MSDFQWNEAAYLRSVEAKKAQANEPTEAQIAAADGFPMAVLFGTAAAILCTVAYAWVWSFGFMLSFIVVGFAWLIATAMLTASKGYGGKPYQIVAVVLTYLTVSCGKLLLPVWAAHEQGTPVPFPTVITSIFIGPVLRLQLGISGILGLVVLGYAIRTAWRMGKGTRLS
jgi:hypothetical protein